MKYRVVILNHSMNPVYSAKFECIRLEDFSVNTRRWLEVFWRYRSKDFNASIRFLPAEPDSQLDLFQEGRDIVF